MPASDPLMVVLDDAATNNVNELYLKFGSPPTRGDYDFIFANPAAADQEILIPTAFAGTWYVLLYSNTTRVSSDYTITAADLPFSVESISPNEAGNMSTITVSIRGARFDTNTTAMLISPTGDRIDAEKILLIDNTDMWATFDLIGAAAGVYDVSVDSLGQAVQVNPDGSVAIVGVSNSAILEDSFNVMTNGSGNLSVDLVVPSVVRWGQVFPVEVVYGNTGQSDVPVPLLTLTAQNAQLYRDVGGLASRSLQFLAWPETEGLQVLPPGTSGTVTFYATATAVPMRLFQSPQPTRMIPHWIFKPSARSCCLFRIRPSGRQSGRISSRTRGVPGEIF